MVKKKSKALRKLEDHHQYLDRKVKELTEDRLKDRSAESKTILMRLKKTKCYEIRKETPKRNQ